MVDLSPHKLQSACLAIVASHPPIAARSRAPSHYIARLLACTFASIVAYLCWPDNRHSLCKRG